MNASDYFPGCAGQWHEVRSKIALKIAGIRQPGYFLIVTRFKCLGTDRNKSGVKKNLIRFHIERRLIE